MLGVRPGADAAEVRAAYRRKVKECHPDQFTDAQRQKQAQDELIRLNLAYEQALKQASQRRVGFNLIAQEEAKHFALRLMEQGNLESALRQLLRADTRDDGWYALQGKILMGLHRYDEAHQSYREAIKLDPDNREYRAGALDAVVAAATAKSSTSKFKIGSRTASANAEAVFQWNKKKKAWVFLPRF